MHNYKYRTADKYLARPGRKDSPGICKSEETGLPGFHFLDHPPYSPDLTPSDYHLFLGLRKIEREAGRAKDLSAPQVPDSCKETAQSVRNESYYLSKSGMKLIELLY
jgi:hypothetical protein